MYGTFEITPLMTSAEFEMYVQEMPRAKALKALSLADVILLPHVSNFARRQWLESITKILKPKFKSTDMLTFNGRSVTIKQLKGAFNSVAKKFGYGMSDEEQKVS